MRTCVGPLVLLALFVVEAVAIRAQAQQPAPAAAVDGPLAPDQALAAFALEPGLRVELAAAEPTIESPVAIAFDENGLMYVAENRGYPTGPADAGQIALLEDPDGDGRYQRRATFAAGLSYPNGLLPWNGGLIVTCAGHFVSARHRRRWAGR